MRIAYCVVPELVALDPELVEGRQAQGPGLRIAYCVVPELVALDPERSLRAAGGCRACRGTGLLCVLRIAYYVLREELDTPYLGMRRILFMSGQAFDHESEHDSNQKALLFA